MADSVWTELEIAATDVCPIARASTNTDGAIDHVARSLPADSDGTVREEFALSGQDSVDQRNIETVFESPSRSVYQFDRKRTQSCICDCIGRNGCPVSEIHARNGSLFVSFYAPDLETVRDIVTELRGFVDELSVRQLTREVSRSGQDIVFVERNRLTDRQREVLETCYEMGYYDYPKRANASEVAAAVGISPSTFSEHLAAAQRKLLEMVLQA